MNSYTSEWSEFSYKPMSNRERKLWPKKTQGWCDNCDRAIVANSKKCPLCQKRAEGKGRYKKIKY